MLIKSVPLEVWRNYLLRFNNLRMAEARFGCFFDQGYLLRCRFDRQGSGKPPETALGINSMKELEADSSMDLCLA